MLYSKRRKNLGGGGVENATTEGVMGLVCEVAVF